MANTICSTPDCKHNSKGRKYCSGCRARQTRERDIVRYSYTNLKHRAKERGKEFTLTLEEFREFCVQSDYIDKKGRKSGCFNIDRIDNTKGYTKDNIRSLEKIENIKKYHQIDKLEGFKPALDEMPF